MRFAHLHVHTEYSLLDGACRVSEAPGRAKQLGMDHLAMTDHGVMYGAVEFYAQCRDLGVKPIIGCEIYVARGSRHEKTAGPADKPYHLVLIAEDDVGYKNLLKIVSIGSLEGFYYRPRVDREILGRYGKGLIALTGCIEGEVPRRILEGREDLALEALSTYRDIFGRENVFLELQRHGIAEQETAGRGLLRLHQKTGAPLVATNDCHYLERSDAEPHEVLLAIQTGTTIHDPGRLRFDSPEFYLKSPQEMAALFHDIPLALHNTLVVAERANVEMELGGIHLPEFPLPPGQSATDVLRRMTEEGLRRRTGGQPDKAREERLTRELEMIQRMGYSSYFLIVHDFVSWAQSRGIAVGPGRGSAAGSIVAYSLGITDTDPIDYDLVFERFLNPERVSMPDIDIDFQDDRRHEVIEYVKGRYGEDRVAQIITFGTMAARAVVRDVGRALGLGYGQVDRIAKMIPAQPGMTLKRAMELSSALRDAKEDKTIGHLLSIAEKLEGAPRHSSIHAAGVVIGKEPLWDRLPLQRTQDGDLVTQYPMESLEALGLLKIDFLALRTLTVMQKTKDLVRKGTGKQIDMHDLPLGDKETYEMLGRGESLGVFQLESSWVRDFLKELRPKRIEDLIATVALCRPGPMQQIPQYLRARASGPEYPHPSLEPVLRETHGVLVYQEQILKLVNVIAGFSLGEADVLRRAVGKKDLDSLLHTKARFMTGAKDRGVSAETAEGIFDLIAQFAGYGFPKNHAAPYALVAYQTAYLKAHHPKEFIAALLSSVAGEHDKVGIYLEEARRLGVGVFGPSVNRSDTEFSVDGGSIRYGLSGIKNVGEGLAEAIVAARRDRGPFASLADLASRIDGSRLTKKALESLIRSGACDDLGTRYDNLENMALALEARLPSRTRSQPSLFDMAPAPDVPDRVKPGSRGKSEEKITLGTRLAWERDLLGMYVSGRPLAQYSRVLGELATPINQLPLGRERAQVRIGGQISSVKKVITRSGDEMAFVGVEDDFDSIEVIVFPRLYARVRSTLIKDRVVLVRGSLEEHEETRRILASDLLPADTFLGRDKQSERTRS